MNKLFLFKTHQEAFTKFSETYIVPKEGEAPFCLWYHPKKNEYPSTLEDFQKYSYPMIVSHYILPEPTKVKEWYKILSKELVIQAYTKAYEDMNKCLFYLDDLHEKKLSSKG